jgi:hypothetical protein
MSFVKKKHTNVFNNNLNNILKTCHKLKPKSKKMAFNYKETILHSLTNDF